MSIGEEDDFVGLKVSLREFLEVGCILRYYLY